MAQCTMYLIPNQIPSLGMAIPRTIPIPREPSCVNPGIFIPRAMFNPASGSADRPHYSEHPA
eukprot:2967369-Heterocapsa_arctica.AAC.1